MKKSRETCLHYIPIYYTQRENVPEIPSGKIIKKYGKIIQPDYLETEPKLDYKQF